MKLKIPSFLILVLGFFNLKAIGNPSDSIKPSILKKEDYINHLDSLKKEFGINKTFYKKLELPALVALSYFPQLKHTKIEFRRHKLSSTMAARPTIGSAFRQKGKRKYLISLDDFDADIPFDDAAFNEQVGVIGHELSHIIYYEEHSALHLMSLSFKYSNKKFKAKFEKDTDRRTVTFNLGWQLYAWKIHGETHPNVSDKRRKYKAKYYLNSVDLYNLTLAHIRKSRNEKE